MKPSTIVALATVASALVWQASSAPRVEVTSSSAGHNVAINVEGELSEPVRLKVTLIPPGGQEVDISEDGAIQSEGAHKGPVIPAGSEGAFIEVRLVGVNSGRSYGSSQGFVN